ncbi:MAG: hypothetical protein LBU45_01085 [Azoarcus sp.]|jgi:hypothetical protein|nr:hypothetical protein [Azoarcus sp.]
MNMKTLKHPPLLHLTHCHFYEGKNPENGMNCYGAARLAMTGGFNFPHVEECPEGAGWLRKVPYPPTATTPSGFAGGVPALHSSSVPAVQSDALRNSTFTLQRQDANKSAFP